ncbi:hypothetical protein [Aeromicrobium sp. CTD01-1L150]|uniref:hypothetical protein n=1 Tax=Aeromicrobium sp. CTD01-1L150 TaxID=3341830 RepID=UPI0035BF38D5
MRPTLPVLGLLLGGLLAGCSPSAETTVLPEGVTLHLDQSRMERQGREVFLRVTNHGDEPMHITGFVLESDRFEPVVWEGEETVSAGYERDLEFELPPSRCGAEPNANDHLRADVELTYRFGDQGRTSRGTAVDRYGAVTRAMDGDCARHTLKEAADLTVGAPQVVHPDARPVLEVPVTLAPTGRRDDVRFGGFEPTVLFTTIEDPHDDLGVRLGPDDPVLQTALRVVPARCDAHALADDKVGTLFGVRVLADDLPDGAAFSLPLPDETRTALKTYLQSACGLD